MVQKAVAVLLLFFAGTCLGAVPPANDTFANRIVLVGTQAVSAGSLGGATRETLEVLCVSPLPSVWWSWTAPEDGTVVVQILNISQTTSSANWLAIYNPADDNTDFPMFGGVYKNEGCFPFERMSSGIWHTFTVSAGRTYYFQVSGNSDATFKLAVSLNPSPILFGQPRDITVTEGQGALFTAKAAGVPPFQYQWQHEGTNLPNATYPTFAVTNAALTDAGEYSVLVSSSAGVTTSHAARLVVTQNQPGPRLAAVSSSADQLSFALQGQRGRFYRIESSTNLVDWLPSTNFFKMHSGLGPLMTSLIYASNDVSSLAVPAKSQRFYVRASQYVPANETCNLNLKRLRFAKNVWALENKKTSTDTPVDTDLFGRMDVPKYEMHCPDGGTYTLGVVGTLPACTVHVNLLEEPFE